MSNDSKRCHSQSRLMTSPMRLETEIVRNKFGIVLDLTEYFKTNGNSIKFFKISDQNKLNCLYETHSWNDVKKLAYFRTPIGCHPKIEDVFKASV